MIRLVEVLLGSYLLVVVLAPHLLALEKYEPVQLQPNLDQASNLTAGNWQNPLINNVRR
jgi:hypothetical protein